VLSPRSQELESLEAVHRSAVALDFEQAPMRGDTWLTGSLIDYILLQFAKEYKDVCFLPVNFAAHDAARAVSSATMLRSLRPNDLLGQSVLTKVGASS